MATWFAYWKSAQIKDALGHAWLDHIGSNRLGRVSVGDTVWIVGTDRSQGLVTIGPLVIDRLLTLDEARRALDYEPWDADWHAFAADGRSARARSVPLGRIAARIRFISRGVDRLDLSRRHSLGGQLQTMRRLTPESAALVDATWRSSLKQETRRLRSLEPTLAELEELDARRETLVRKEQASLRRHLLGAEAVGLCVICGREFPVELLVAAHVKPRFRCNDDEKRDFLGNVVPMCRFGCDELFERGFIAVRGGVVVDGKQLGHTEAVSSYLQEVVGSRCRAWNSRAARYFVWHAKHVAQLT